MKIGKFELDKIYCGDCRELIKDLPNNSIDMSITSPPYWGGLRDYGKETEVVWDEDENCEHEWQTNSEVKEMFKDSGSGWLIGHEKGKKEAKVISRNEHPEYWEKKEIKTNFCSKCRAWKGQLGVEPDFNLYIKHLCDIFDDVKRVLKKEGTCWVVLGDTYSSGGGAGSGEYRKRHTQFGKIMESKSQSLPHKTKDYPKKSLVMIPFRFAIEMVNRGWILRNIIIWHKPSCMPSSAKDRFTVDFEYLFFFSKSKKYYFEQQFEPWTDKNKYDIERAIHGHKEYKGKYKSDKKGSFSFSESKIVGDPLRGRNKRTVWSITTKGFKEAHFAVFPPELIETPIKAGCPEFVCKKCGKAREKIIEIDRSNCKIKKWNEMENELTDKQKQDNWHNRKNISGIFAYSIGAKRINKGYSICNCSAGFDSGVILDPFIGSGTTGEVAIKQRKHFIGFEINPEYVEMANRGLESVQVSML